MREADEATIVKAGACHDCGGRCPYVLHVSKGKVVRVEPCDALRPCVRVFAFAKKLYSPDRLKFPQRRVGKRGEGRFERVSWDEAFRDIAAALTRIRDSYGAESIVFAGGSGHASAYLQSPEVILRLLNKFGGCTTTWGGASAESSTYASRVTYGTMSTQHTRDDLVNSKLIILWGWNPAVSIQGTDTAYWLVKAKEAGARIVAIDPHLTASAGTLADWWLPVRAGTDTALALAIAHTMLEQGLHNQAFLDRYTVGFGQFRDYLLGKEDGVVKTADWASAVTGTPAAAIRQLAQDYSTMRPAALMPGFAPGRTRYGAQFHRAVSTLAAMTGNIGINGGSPAGFDRPLVIDMMSPHIPVGKNPTETSAPRLAGSLDDKRRSAFRLHQTTVWDAILRGKEGGYRTDFKAAYFLGSNWLNQLSNVQKGVQALRKLDFVVVHEQFLTPTAKFADILLPATSHWERSDIFRPWVQGGYYLYSNQAIDPLFECKSDLEIARGLAPYLSIDDFGDLSDDGWLREITSKYPEDAKYLTDLDALQREGLLRVSLDEPLVPFRDQIADPDNHPFPTPSGRIEIFSAALAALEDPHNPPIPKFFPEDLTATQARRFPLRMTSTHSLVRAHSVWDNVRWLRELQPQAVLLNASDAEARGIRDGETVLIFNETGKLRLRAKVSETMMPGIVDIPEGAWYDPDEAGIDAGGNPNTLTPDQCSPGGGHILNGIPVQIERLSR